MLQNIHTSKEVIVQKYHFQFCFMIFNIILDMSTKTVSLKLSSS